MRILLVVLLLGTGGVLSDGVRAAQTSIVWPKTFEVASVKPAKPGERGSDIWGRTGRLGYTNVPLDTIIISAYHIKPEQLQNAPSWTKLHRYTIVAEAPPELAKDLEIARKLPAEQRQQAFAAHQQSSREMMQNLLADRFKLKVHPAVKRLPLYELVVAKGGPKLKPASKADYVAAHVSYAPGNESVTTRYGNMSALGTSMKALSELLSRQLDRMVIDKTGLTGVYDFTLTWSPWRSEPGIAASDRAAGEGGRANADDSGPSIFTAIQQQLGLKLKPAKGPVEMLVVDHIEPPTPD